MTVSAHTDDTDTRDHAHAREVALTLSLKTGKVNESNEEIIARAAAFLAFLEPVTPDEAPHVVYKWSKPWDKLPEAQ
jgi:hypothetical protein